VDGYSYTLNNPQKYVDTDGHFPILAITAAGGAVVGGIVGATREYANQIAASGHVTSSGRIWTAAGRGALAGGLAGLTLGIGAGTAAAAGAAETATVIGSTTVIGDLAQHRANDSLGLTNPGENETELTDTALDAGTAGLAGGGSAKLADALIPIPNIRQEIKILRFASRRSTRAVRIQSAQNVAQLKAGANTLIGNGVGAGIQQTLRYLWSFITGTQQQQKPVKDCVTTDAVGGGRSTTCE